MKYFSLDQVESLLWCPNGYIRSKDREEKDKFIDVLAKCCFKIDGLWVQPQIVEKINNVFTFPLVDVRTNKSKSTCKISCIRTPNQKYIERNFNAGAEPDSVGRIILRLSDPCTILEYIREAL